MEAALRTAYNIITKQDLQDVEIKQVRGLDGIKEGVIDIDGKEIKVAVAHGMVNVGSILNKVRKAAEKGEDPPYHFIEVMACRGGCIAGGGQPYYTTDEVRQKRMEGIYRDDKMSEVRCSHQNPEIQILYKEFLGEPLSHISHELLHTTYTPRPLHRL